MGNSTRECKGFFVPARHFYPYRLPFPGADIATPGPATRPHSGRRSVKVPESNRLS